MEEKEWEWLEDEKIWWEQEEIDRKIKLEEEAKK